MTTVDAPAQETQETVPGFVLPAAAEPAATRARLRGALLGGADWQGTFGDELGLGDELWAAWGPVLEAAGLARPAFAAVVRGYRRELWLWLLGDRVWEQVATGLAGRVSRRLPTS